jgi:hypothetical protein
MGGDFDEQLGPALRAAVVTPLFRHDPEIALRVLTTGMPERAYLTLRPLLRIFPCSTAFATTSAMRSSTPIVPP